MFLSLSGPLGGFIDGFEAFGALDIFDFCDGIDPLGERTNSKLVDFDILSLQKKCYNLRN